ncbi:MAG: ATP-binding protein [Scytonema sp. PMC 1069.18]|nr:ATP-binding protein [Scytonema sp. PMC 1069.18]
MSLTSSHLRLRCFSSYALMLHLLTIDDDQNDLLLIARELHREFADINITQVTNIIDLEQVLNAKRPDLVITDYQLRWSNGIAVLQEVKSRYPNCPVIMFTNTGSEEVAVEAMKAGLDDYIIKSPRHFVRLTVAVRSALERVAAHRQIVRLENRLQFLLDQLNLGVFRATTDGRLLEFNKAFARLLGLKVSQVEIGRDLSQLFWSTDTPTVFTNQSREIEFSLTDREIRWLLLNQTLNTTDDETYIFGLLEDITERKHTENELRQLNEMLETRVRERTAELEEVNDSLKEFAYVISHDLRAPLRSIQGFAQALQADYPNQLDRRAQEYLHRIILASDKLNTLIGDLLNYSQLSRARLQLEPVNLSEVLSEAINQLTAELQTTHTQITVIEPLPMVMGNPSILLQVLINLLSNAVKFVESGKQPQVCIYTHSLGETVRLWVEDNGIGVPLERQGQIFGVFERLHGEETYPGIGMGLAIVRKAVERMGGMVGVESQVGRGSRFWISLQKYDV